MLTRAPAGVSACPRDDSDVRKWSATIDGPPDSPFFGGRFRLSLDFPPDYPLRAPAVAFRSRLFHPNVDPRSGAVCVDLLEDARWTVLESITGRRRPARDIFQLLCLAQIELVFHDS